MHWVEVPWLWLIPALPLLGATYAGLLGAGIQRRWGQRAIHLPTVLLPWLSFALVVLGFFRLLAGSPQDALHQRLWTWLDLGLLKLDIAFTLDRLSVVMCLVITFVGSLIHVYSTGYMRKDPGYARFFAYLNLFLAAMLILVLADNLLLMFVGWEGVGLCSYLLIGFWYSDLEKARAGMKAFVVNRVGDAGFVVGLSLLFWSLAQSAPLAVSPELLLEAAAPNPGLGLVEPAARPAALEPGLRTSASTVVPDTSLNFRELEQILHQPERQRGLGSVTWGGVSATTLICLLLFLGATGKSAQLPLHVWLPDAMAGPTPVSALIHAATMVTAGVYLLARLHFLFALSPWALTVVATVGATTALLAAAIGLFQHDIKKVLAYSTVSQLGFMFVALGAGAFWVAIFHLVTHALFKACLFLGSGSVILGCHHQQDMRQMGGLKRFMPVTARTYLVSSLAIAGFPFFSGFFSKDEILWRIFDTGNVLLPGGGLLPWLLATVAATFTAYYVFRSYYLTFTGEYRAGGSPGAHPDTHPGDHSHAADELSDAHHADHALPHESPRSMTVPLVVLASLAAMAGLLGLPRAWHLPNYFESWLEPVFADSMPHLGSRGNSHAVEWALMGLSVALAVLGWSLARWLYREGKSAVLLRLAATENRLLRQSYRLLYHKVYLDELYDLLIVRPAHALARWLGWLDSHAVDGVVHVVAAIGRLMGQLQGLIDKWLVDGLVNLVGDGLIGLGRGLRTLQTGRIQSYLVGLLAGSVLLFWVAYIVPW
jgi:NADH-quinone oxidoreductase subunit L